MHESRILDYDFLGVPMKFDLVAVYTTGVTCLLVFLLVFFAARRPSLVPTGAQNVLESVMGFVQGMVKEQIKPGIAPRFYGFTLSLFLYILVANQVGLLTSMPSVMDHHHYVWWKSPTANINVALVMAVAITYGAHGMGIARHGWRYLCQYKNPFELFGLVTQPLTHGMRLWANIMAGEIVIGVLLQAGSWVMMSAPLIVWLGYSIFVGVIQAYVFSVLAMVYIGNQLGDPH
ncbi:F0F1 ATP synthase subunit A [Pasteuria penetrans]|uniref:F0F1 ATP synthase subunit A n=1 Tax=Pasteuria penetrans TaxID=86005 RepID=UPI000FB1268C|nr:F0F1 ATP synthase subunit A [Pasteuria penetrans]